MVAQLFGFWGDVWGRETRCVAMHGPALLLPCFPARPSLAVLGAADIWLLEMPARGPRCCTMGFSVAG